jgi:hypothetical protein
MTRCVCRLFFAPPPPILFFPTTLASLSPFVTACVSTPSLCRHPSAVFHGQCPPNTAALCHTLGADDPWGSLFPIALTPWVSILSPCGVVVMGLSCHLDACVSIPSVLCHPVLREVCSPSRSFLNDAVILPSRVVVPIPILPACQWCPSQVARHWLGPHSAVVCSP